MSSKLNQKIASSFLHIFAQVITLFPFFEAEAKLTEELMMKEFAKLHSFLRQEEAARLLALKKEKEEKISKSDERIDRMNQVIKSLEQKIQLIEGELDAGGDGADFLQVTSIK